MLGETAELLMTAPHARQPQVLPRPACTPTAIRTVLAANADGGTLQRYDEDLDAAYEHARDQGDVTPLVQTVKRWWFEADAWRDPQAQREFQARIDTYRDEGPPPAEQRMSREEIRTQFGASDACTGGSWMARLSGSSPTCPRPREHPWRHSWTRS
jgi:Family of unknown function (DUF6247)